MTFQVRDSGVGIAPEAQERIFGEFEQAESGTTRRFGGTGLGLAISQRIIKRMGARIAVDSRPGDGATFHFTVELPAAGDTAETAAPSPDLAGQSILVVGSSAFEAPLLAERVERWGARVRHVADAAAAQRAIAQERWDALIVDVAIGADEAVSLAHGASIGRRIVLIAPSDRRELAALRSAGFTGYLVKPVRAASLMKLLATGPGADLPIATDPTHPARSRTGSATRLSVLVAEDNDINALLARALLAKLGHRPTIAGSGGAAVEAWRNARASGQPYDLVLMDLQMPEMDGIEAARRIRGEEDERHRTPILALTANASSEDRDACLAAGMNGVLVKPLEANRLSEAMAYATRTASSHAA
jgi:CheY-like chemotaxis protein